jgi:hypothetical protein
MNMEYWGICIEEAFSECGILATEEQIKTVVEWVDGAHENYGTATGSEHIPNPMSTEVEELKAKIKKLEVLHYRQLDGIAKGVAKRRGVSASNVSIDDDGLVTYK